MLSFPERAPSRLRARCTTLACAAALALACCARAARAAEPTMAVGAVQQRAAVDPIGTRYRVRVAIPRERFVEPWSFAPDRYSVLLVLDPEATDRVLEVLCRRDTRAFDRVVNAGPDWRVELDLVLADAYPDGTVSTDARSRPRVSPLGQPARGSRVLLVEGATVQPPPLPPEQRDALQLERVAAWWKTARVGESEEVTLTLRSHMRARRVGDDMQLALTPATATASLVVHYPALSEIARRVRRWRGRRVRMRLEVVRAVDALGVASRRLEVRELEALEPPQPPAASANATPAPHEQPPLRVTVLTPEGRTVTIEGVRPGVPRARDGYTVIVEPE